MIIRLKALGLAGILMMITPQALTQVLQNDDMTCPDSPNCVSSMADKESSHYILPFTFDDSPESAMKRLKTALANEKRVKLVKDSSDFLSAEVTSLLFRFIDDIEFRLLIKEGLIHVRSSSRSGYYDLGVNKRRIERIRRLFQK